MIYKSKYEVTQSGEVYNKKRNVVKKQSITKNGYCVTSINGKMEYVHRIIADCFVPNEYNKAEVNHIDGNRLNNSVSNLEWMTSSENIKHSYDKLGRTGRPQNFWKGKKHKAETIEKMRLAKLK